MKKLKLIYIAGSGRSGSTLLDLLLGQIKGFFSLGEVYYIWEDCFIKNQLCGCGKPFKDCKFWKKVIKSLNYNERDIRNIIKLHRSLVRTRYLFQLIFPKLRSRKFNLKLERYKEILKKLYLTISEISGCQVLIDSSKWAGYAAILSEIKEVDFYLIHLVRDSRAVAYSVQRKKQKTDVYWKKAYLPYGSIFKGVYSWLYQNLSLELLKKTKNIKCVYIKYENLALKPKETLHKILKKLNIQAKIDFFQDNEFDLRKNHTVSGNPMRMNKGFVKISPDIEWTLKMSLTKKSIVTLLTLPLLYYYKIKKE